VKSFVICVINRYSDSSVQLHYEILQFL